MKRPFVGHIVSGRPVTTKDGMKAGIVKGPPVCPYCGSNNVDFNICTKCKRNVTETLKPKKNEQQEKT